MQNESERIEVILFKFDEEWRVQPIEFEATFIYGGALNRIGFAIDANRVCGEWLFARPNQSEIKSRRLFQREYDSMAGTCYWTEQQDKRNRKELWKKSTTDSALHLSTATQLGSTRLWQIIIIPRSRTSSYHKFSKTFCRPKYPAIFY